MGLTGASTCRELENNSSDFVNYNYLLAKMFTPMLWPRTGPVTIF